MALTQSERNRRYLASPKGQFAKHRQNARSRGIEFLLTFDEWWEIWNSDGSGWKYSRRGNHDGCYVMSRDNDEGPYKRGNVSIQKFTANVAERNRTVLVKKRHTANTTTVTFEPMVRDSCRGNGTPKDEA